MCFNSWDSRFLFINKNVEATIHLILVIFLMTLVFSGLKKIFVDLNANKTIGTMNGPMGKIKSQITRKTLRFLKLFLSITGTEYVPTIISLKQKCIINLL